MTGPILHPAKRQIDMIRGETFVSRETKLQAPFFAEYEPKSPGQFFQWKPFTKLEYFVKALHA